MWLFRHASVLFLLVITAAPSARADGGSPRPAGGSVPAFEYEHPVKKNYLRASLEIPVVLALGWVQYASSTNLNSRDWDLGYDWPSFRSKLTGEAVRFDTNRFDTNMITHPTSGWLYYVAARGNRLDIFESFAFAFAASAFWEYVGEIREKASINDLIVTPLAGMAIGEVLTQLGAYFDRGADGAVTETLSLLFGTSKRVHDLIDGNHPRRSRDVDALGFSRETGHAFAFGLGIGATSQASGVYTDTTLRLRAHLANVPEYDHVGYSSRFLVDGNFSKLEMETTFGGLGLADVWFLAQTAPLGWYEQSVHRDRAGRLEGGRFFVGTTVGFDYGLHVWDRSMVGSLDQISSVHAAGVTVEHDVFFRGLHLRSTLDVHPSFAAVRSFAIDRYVALGRPMESLPSVTSSQSYYFAVGAVAAPRIELGYAGWQLGAEARVEDYSGVQGLDRAQEHISGEVALHDRRVAVKAWIAFAPIEPLVLSIAIARRARTGEVADVAARRDETSLLAGATAVF